MALCVSRDLPRHHPTRYFKKITCCSYHYHKDQWARDDFDGSTLKEDLEQAATTHIGSPCGHQRIEPIPVSAPRIHDPLIRAVKGGVKLGANVAIAGARLAHEIPVVRETSDFVTTNLKNISGNIGVQDGARRVSHEADVIKNNAMNILISVAGAYGAVRKRIIPQTPQKSKKVYRTGGLRAFHHPEVESRTMKEYEQGSDEEEEEWEVV